MSLIESSSQKAFEENISKERHSGKSLAQSLAIAFSVKRKNKNKKKK